MDIFSDRFIKKEYKPNKPTKKLLFIGGSNKGKTTHMINYFLHLIPKCCGIVFICPVESHKDEKKLILQEWCEEAGMPVFFFTENNFFKAPHFPDDCVYFVDDCYTSSDRNPEVEFLVKHLVNVGRHEGIHIFYAAHLATRLPPEIKCNSTNIFLHVQFAVKEDTYEKLGLRDASNVLLQKKEKLDPYSWFIYDDSDIFEGKLIPLLWPEIKTRKDIIEMIKKKIPKEHKEAIKELIKVKEHSEEVKKKEENMRKENTKHQQENNYSILDLMAGKYYKEDKGINLFS